MCWIIGVLVGIAYLGLFWWLDRATKDRIGY